MLKAFYLPAEKERAINSIIIVLLVYLKKSLERKQPQVKKKKCNIPKSQRYIVLQKKYRNDKEAFE